LENDQNNNVREKKDQDFVCFFEIWEKKDEEKFHVSYIYMLLVGSSSCSSTSSSHFSHLPSFIQDWMVCYSFEEILFPFFD